VNWTLAGYRTYLAAAGLLGLALYQFSSGQFEPGVQSVLAAAAAFGLRKAIAAAPAATAEAVLDTPVEPATAASK